MKRKYKHYGYNMCMRYTKYVMTKYIHSSIFLLNMQHWWKINSLKPMDICGNKWSRSVKLTQWFTTHPASCHFQPAITIVHANLATEYIKTDTRVDFQLLLYWSVNFKSEKCIWKIYLSNTPKYTSQIQIFHLVGFQIQVHIQIFAYLNTKTYLTPALTQGNT